jgi:hypothetical protein
MLLEQILVITPKIHLKAWQAPKQASKRASFRLPRQASKLRAVEVAGKQAEGLSLAYLA